MKKRLGIIVVLALVCGAAGAAYAAGPITLLVNGVQVKTEVAPQIIGGRTMVPIRAVAEALDADVAWYPASNTVAITKEMPPKLMKLDGEQTTWPYWEEDDHLYLERRNCVELLRSRYGSPWYSVSISGNSLAINNRSFYIPDLKKKDELTLVPLDEIALKSLLKYDWEPESGNLTLIRE